MSIVEILGFALPVVLIVLGWAGIRANKQRTAQDRAGIGGAGAGSTGAGADSTGQARALAPTKLSKKEQAELDAHHTIHWRNSPAQLHGDPAAWPMVASTSYALCRSAPVDVFTFLEPQVEAEMLATVWGAHTPAELREQIYFLLYTGNRQSFDSERRRWSELGDSDRQVAFEVLRAQANIDPQAVASLLRFQWVQSNTNDATSIDFLAWDLVRAIMLCRAGVAAGLLREEEAVDTALVASKLLQERYPSWTDMGLNFLRGRWYWTADNGAEAAERMRHDLHAQNLLTSDPSSPWNAVEWDLPIPKPQHLMFGR
ncbi:MAG: DUF1266 domain-containing protein [Ancrocorticia sp.]